MAQSDLLPPSNLPRCYGSETEWTDCYGSKTYFDGMKYIGEFKNAEKDGNGKLTLGNKTYIGEFKNNFYDGQGIFISEDGSKYVGEWRLSSYSGLGIEFGSDGKVKRSGFYQRHRLVREEVVRPETFARLGHYLAALNVSTSATRSDQTSKNPEESEVVSALPLFRDMTVDEFAAKIISFLQKNREIPIFTEFQIKSDFPRCTGVFYDRWSLCVGTIDFGHGLKFTGEFKQGRYHGYGKFEAPDEQYEGFYQRGVREGLGVYSYANGSKYFGEFKAGARNGKGILIGKDGAVIARGTWNDGTFADPLSESAFNALWTPSTTTEKIATDVPSQVVRFTDEISTSPSELFLTQGKRVALVIGNAKYRFSPLNNPVNDATDMAASLRSVGFDVIEIRDANKRQMRAATRRFEDKLAASDVGLVYYSGHGVEVKGRNYLIPVDADIRREHEVEDQAFDAGNILRMMESLQGTEKNRVNIMIVDACRNNDLARSWRSTNRGLARMDAPTGSFISFATAPGQVASDGNGRNSPFTKHLLQALKQPNVPIELVFKEVRRNVMDETGGEQVPWENSSLVGDFYFTVAR